MPELWVIDNVISAPMMLLNQGNAFPVATTFVLILCTTIRLKSIPYYGAFLVYTFPKYIDTVVSKLNEFLSVLIPILSRKFRKTKNGKGEISVDHCGSTAEHCNFTDE